MTIKKIPIGMYIGFLVHCGIVASFALDNDPMRRSVGLFCTIPLALNLIGLMLALFTSKSAIGAKLFKYTSFLFIPAGVIGILASNKLIEQTTN
ncbi:hypothetical protein [Pseudozobellia thermophila]|nr:hypothetical protein [Pseudozobellia thermophila]